ncbi:hypothetical protein IWX90DRAFT_262411 [Phyllosticta citrichinensis]|uniref:Uncharacterized protein n=1 Tax=Phyllosticta citrichinensis TaxID=1130410 RepID=A0ABR1XSD3_9PEZI
MDVMGGGGWSARSLSVRQFVGATTGRGHHSAPPIFARARTVCAAGCCSALDAPPSRRSCATVVRCWLTRLLSLLLLSCFAALCAAGPPACLFANLLHPLRSGRITLLLLLYDHLLCFSFSQAPFRLPACFAHRRAATGLVWFGCDLWAIGFPPAVSTGRRTTRAFRPSPHLTHLFGASSIPSPVWRLRGLALHRRLFLIRLWWFFRITRFCLLLYTQGARFFFDFFSTQHLEAA